MDSTQLDLVSYMANMNTIFMSTIGILGTAIVAMYFIQMSNMKKIHDRDHKDREQLIEVIKDNTSSKKELTISIDKQTSMIKELPDTIYTIFKARERK